MDFSNFNSKVRNLFNKKPGKMPDALAYLSPGFDPNSLTIQELSSILAANDVRVPMTRGKKSAYVDLFVKNITARRSELLKQYKNLAKIKPKSAGIVQVDVDGTERELGGSDFEDEDENSSSRKSV